MKKSLNILLSFVIVSVALFMFPTYSVAAEPGPSLTKKELKTLLATAQSPAEHRTIAAYYRQQAQALAAKSAEHSAMAEQFARSAASESKQGTLGVSHCRYFAKQYAEQSNEAATLASAHEEMATKAEQR
jgi:hypothetical protein